jgi:prephenate dehydrogenase
MKRIAILGLGLMGASLGLALKKRLPSLHVVAYARRQATRDAALAEGVADVVLDRPAEAVRDADVVVLCVPIMTMPSLLEECAEGLKPGCIVTDVGSTKADLAQRLTPMLKGTQAVFIGSHPVCGSEKQGLEEGDPDLYEGAVVVVTPTEDQPEEAVTRLTGLWEQAGSVVRLMTPLRHDQILARTSHLPHMAAVLVAAAVAREDVAEVGAFCGNGFQDTTRIAEGSPDIWRDIAESNEDALLGELQALRMELDAMTQMLSNHDYEQLHRYLETVRTQRQTLLASRRDGPGTA